MARWITALLLVLFATNAFADVLCEGFPDPLGEWRDRWLAQNSNMTNYYVCSGYTGDENYRGNNDCGLWICDTDDDFNTADIVFNPVFGATVVHFAISIVRFVDVTYTVYDLGGNVVYTVNLSYNGQWPPCTTEAVECDTPNGLGRFTIVPQPGQGQVEGNTSVDNVCATICDPSAVQGTTWGGVKSIYR